MLIGYSGEPAGTGVLEDCLRAVGAGASPQRGEIARQLRRITAHRQANLRRYRQRQYHAPQEISAQLRRLRSYRRYRLYYLGERHGDLPLTAIVTKLQPPAYAHSVKRLPAPTSPTFTFIYGDCTPPPDREGGCAPPLSIQNFEICAVSPKSYDVRPSALTEQIRSAPIFGNTGAGSLNVFTGKTTVTIFAEWQVAKRAARHLRSIDGAVTTASKLPSPVAGALEGRLRCQPPDED